MSDETRARRRWIGLILAFFAGQVVLWTFAITTVSSDPSHAVVPDYDAKALDWDQERERRDASAALRWTATVELDDGGAVKLTLLDAHDHAVDGAHVHLTLFHNAEAAHRQRVSLHAMGDGTYAGAARLHRKGKWTVAVEATRGQDAYAHSLVTDL
jgi:nitrogen fixation protein FixH